MSQLNYWQIMRQLQQRDFMVEISTSDKIEKLVPKPFTQINVLMTGAQSRMIALQEDIEQQERYRWILDSWNEGAFVCFLHKLDRHLRCISPFRSR